jgi:Rhodopirellula transposase DDE domain
VVDSIILPQALTVQCRIDQTAYDNGIKVSDAEMAALKIRPADFHGEWNYTFTPRKPDDWSNYSGSGP